MNKAKTLFLTLFCGLALAAGAQAADMNHSGHDMQGGHGSDQAMDNGHMGEKIHESAVEGYQLRYELIDMRAQMAGHEMPPEMKTHHLMVYVTDPKGDTVERAKTGYLVTGPAGEQKAMAMAMSGGYGADVDLKPAGTYTMKTKVVTPDGKTLLDQFTYEAK